MDFQQNRRPLTREKHLPPHRLCPNWPFGGSMPGSGENQPQNHPHGKEKPGLLEHGYFESEYVGGGVEENASIGCLLHRAAERDRAPLDQPI